jgi:hypothetical protein
MAMLTALARWIGWSAERTNGATIAPPAPSAPGLSDAQLAEILQTVRPYTMVSEAGIALVAREAVRLIAEKIPGVLVECGVWKGGSSLAMLLAQRMVFGRVVRPVYLLDSFEGLPPVTARDGPLANDWQRQANPTTFHDNCRASREELTATLNRLGFTAEEARVIPGWFEQTVPDLAAALQADGIALLRLDGDWYDSTMVCLERLVPITAEDGLIVVDDYYAWDGCARALHDFLSRWDLPYRIRSVATWQGVYFYKKAHRDRFDVL